jgi:hypothetical protein
MFSLNVILQRFTLYPDWFKVVSAVKILYSDYCCLNAQNKGAAETGIKDYHYRLPESQFQGSCDDFQVQSENNFTCLEM